MAVGAAHGHIGVLSGMVDEMGFLVTTLTRNGALQFVIAVIYCINRGMRDLIIVYW